MVFPEISKIKNELKDKEFDQGFHWKILFIGTSVNGTTDIVSSLSRSLRNLGHHVMDLDTRRHKVLENPLGRQGGMGPIFVKYDLIESALDGFGPQMIICCAGGLTFSESDAQKLKDRGIVLVGMTLSDPDVFPTIREYQHVFDIHTTNAQEAMALYSDAGVNNTLYFPFGIDRGFITQEVPWNDKFEADVICLGHATQRPDRNEVMNYLNSRLDVKTYGRGWEIPNSETVAGQEMVQALLGGKIHVNFPLTRAGYVNIKCGVFESASQGRVVATGNFPEMAEFFDYGDEIIGYDNKEDLENRIANLLSNPVEYKRIATNAFKRVVNEHLYEHRWMTLFAKIKELRLDNPRWLAPTRAHQIQQTLEVSFPRAKIIIVSGFYGARNLGDEMILRSISDHLLNADPAIQVYVAAESPVRVESNHGLQAFERKNHSLSAVHVKNASAVVLGGGGLWHDYTFERGGGIASFFTGGKVSIAGFGILPLMGKVLDIPFHVVGLGVGPLTNKDAIASVRYLANQADSIYVRDSESHDLLKSIGLGGEFLVSAPDVVYAVDLASNSQTKLPVLDELKRDNYLILGLNLRPWANFDMDHVAATVRDAIEKLVTHFELQGRKIAIISLPMQGGVSMDTAAIRKVANELKSSVEFVELDSDGDLGINEFIEALQYCDAMLAMRLHASLIGHRSGVPSVGLCYDPKVRRHFEEIGRGDYGLNLSASSDDLFRMLLLAIGKGMSGTEKAKIRSIETRASTALTDAAERIAASPYNSRVYEVPSESKVIQYVVEKPKNKNAYFKDIRQDFSGIDEITNLEVGIHELALSLDVERPIAGMVIEHRGVLELSGSSSSQILLVLNSKYNNKKASGSLFVELEVGKQLFRQDMSETSSPVQIGVTTPGPAKIPFVFRIVVERDSFKARSWKEATRVTLGIEETRETPKVAKCEIHSTRGHISRIT